MIQSDNRMLCFVGRITCYLGGNGRLKTLNRGIIINRVSDYNKVQ